LNRSRETGLYQTLVAGGWPLGAALAAVFLGAIDLTVISTVLPKIVIDLNINTADIDRYIWIVDAYLIAYIIAIPLVGRLSDVVGRGIAFQCSIAVFVVGSVAAAMSNDLTQLIAARALQGAGGGALMPVTLALVGDLMPAGKRVTVLGLVGAIDTLGWVLGPVWGALIVGIFSGAHDAWRWVFWLNVPAGLVVGIVVHRRIGVRGAARRRTLRQVDLIGAVLLGAALLLLNLGLSSGGESGVSTDSAMRALGGTQNPLSDYLPQLIGGGALLLAGFILWERRSKSPLLPLGLFLNRSFSAALLANFLTGAALITAMVDVPVVVALLVSSDRISVVSALLLAPFTIVMAATSLAGGFISSRLGERRTAFAGFGCVFLGFVAVWLALRVSDYPWMTPGLIIAGAGFGLAVAPIGSTVIETAPEADRGIASASTILFRLLGMTVGISTLTSFGIDRLQRLSENAPKIVRASNESTADFLIRQNEYIQNVAIPLSVQVVRETFLIAGFIGLAALVPVVYLRTRHEHPPAANDG
jgi:MFS family permease